MKPSHLIIGGGVAIGLVWLLTRPTAATATSSGAATSNQLQALANWVKQQLAAVQQSLQKAAQQKSSGASAGAQPGGQLGAGKTGGVTDTRTQLAQALSSAKQTGVANLPSQINWSQFSAGERAYLDQLYDPNGNLIVRAPDATNIIASDLSFLDVPLSGADLVGVVPGASDVTDLSFLNFGNDVLPSYDFGTQVVPGSDFIDYGSIGLADNSGGGDSYGGGYYY